MKISYDHVTQCSHSKDVQQKLIPKAFRRGRLVPCVRCLYRYRRVLKKAVVAPASLAWLTPEGAGPTTALYLSGANGAAVHVRLCDKCELSSVRGPLWWISDCMTSSTAWHNKCKYKYVRYTANWGGLTLKSLFSPPSRGSPLWWSNK